MRAFFRLLFKLNDKYDELREPWRLVVFITPMLIAAILSGLTIIYVEDGMLSLFGEFGYMFVLMFMGLFRLSVFTLSKDWVNTYTVGFPFCFQHVVLISDISNRKEISKWTRQNINWYYGRFKPDKATFYFLKISDAMAFKLKWI